LRDVQPRRRAREAALLRDRDEVAQPAQLRRHDLVASAPDRVHALGLDVARADQIEAAVETTIAGHGRIDVLVNNAGHGSVGAVEKIDLSDLRALMDAMVFGAVALTQAVLPHMRAQGSGAIVQMSSMGGQVSLPGFGAYCSGKFALEAMSEALAAEVAPLGIRVLIVEPGAFRTGFGGARMQRSREIDAYAATVGPTRAFVDGMDGAQPGDPRKAASAILAALDPPAAPLRLALGDDAVGDPRRARAAARRSRRLGAAQPLHGARRRDGLSPPLRRGFAAGADEPHRGHAEHGAGHRDQSGHEVRLVAPRHGEPAHEQPEDHRAGERAEERSHDSAPEAVGEVDREVPEGEADHGPDEEAHQRGLP
jgi:NAD(P)-dependent dehydrogenase (short-subunit alcohol dehydrogenase family)